MNYRQFISRWRSLPVRLLWKRVNLVDDVTKVPEVFNNIILVIIILILIFLIIIIIIRVIFVTSEPIASAAEQI